MIENEGIEHRIDSSIEKINLYILNISINILPLMSSTRPI